MFSVVVTKALPDPVALVKNKVSGLVGVRLHKYL
jgi:hypothetical protein